MELNSLLLRTELIFARVNGQIIERDHYLVVKTPSSPDYHWGNFLVFSDPPKKGDEIKWPEIFKKEFSGLSGINHVALTWNAPVTGGFIKPFEANGFVLEQFKVLATKQVHPPVKGNPNIAVRTVESDQDWEAVTQE